MGLLCSSLCSSSSWVFWGAGCAGSWVRAWGQGWPGDAQPALFPSPLLLSPPPAPCSPSKAPFWFLHRRRGLPALHPPAFLRHLLVDSWTPWRCPGCLCCPPWWSGCSVPLAAPSTAPSRRRQRGPCCQRGFVLQPPPVLPSAPMPESERLSSPCLHWVHRGVFSSSPGQELLCGLGAAPWSPRRCQNACG